MNTELNMKENLTETSCLALLLCCGVNCTGKLVGLTRGVEVIQLQGIDQARGASSACGPDRLLCSVAEILSQQGIWSLMEDSMFSGHQYGQNLI